MMRGSKSTCEAVLLDWGRSRVGSPLEDVSSWLQSLGYWEPEGRRLHDSFLRRYLDLTGLPFDRETRKAYWLAAASNALAGALRYHIAVMLDEAQSAMRRAAAEKAAADWLRVIRRADDYWRAGDGGNLRSSQVPDPHYSNALP